MRRGTALACLHGSVVLFGLSGLIGKTVTSSALVVTCLRSLIGAAALGLVLAWCEKTDLAALRGHWRVLLIGGALLALHWWAFFAAIQRSTVGLGLLTFASYPLFVTLIGRFVLQEPTRPVEALACALVVAGLTLVVPDWNFGSQIGLATAFGLGSGLTFAALTFLNRRATKTMPPLPLVTGQITVAGLLLLPWILPEVGSIPGTDWLWLTLLGVVFTGVAHGLFTASLLRVRVTVVSVVAALEPVYGILAALAFLGEVPSVQMYAGAALIIGASCLTALPFAGPTGHADRG